MLSGVVWEICNRANPNSKDCKELNDDPGSNIYIMSVASEAKTHRRVCVCLSFGLKC